MPIVGLDQSAEFEQDPLEDVAWDHAVIGESYLALLGKGGSAKRDAAFAQPLDPLSQVLLSNSLALSLEDASERAMKAMERANPILAAAVRARRSEPRLELDPSITGTRYAWSPISAIPLAAIDSAFDLFVSKLCQRAHLAHHANPDARLNFNALLFHPLQNAATHGLQQSMGGRFAGICVREVASVTPVPPSLREYLDTYPAQGRPFAEVIVHDSGLGIAEHYYRAQSSVLAPPLSELGVGREWIQLNLAIELHRTSKPESGAGAYPRRRLGVGLFDLLDRVRNLNGYLEVRTGRIRAYRWFRPGELLDTKAQLQPHNGVPKATHPVCGTVFRIVIPIGEVSAASSGRGRP